MQERSQENWRTDPELRRTRTILLKNGDPESKRAEILGYFSATFDIDEALLEVLKYDETFYLRADPLRHMGEHRVAGTVTNTLVEQPEAIDLHDHGHEAVVGILRGQLHGPGETLHVQLPARQSGERVVPGVYYFRLEVGDTATTRKVVVVY